MNLSQKNILGFFLIYVYNKYGRDKYSMKTNRKVAYV